MPDTEIEATLAIRSSAPEEVARRVAGLRTLAGRELSPGPPERLRDVYLDTAEERLREAGVALRLRYTGDVCRVAVKGRGEILPGGGLDRLELERALSPGAWEEIRACLDELGAPLPAEGPPPGDAGDPARTARELGLRVVQDRETVRRPAELRPGDGETRGEVVVDRVSYRPGSLRALHFEVEVEAEGPDARDLVGTAAAELRTRFGDDLVPWDYPKLATGRALARLAERGAMEALLGPDGALLPRAYERLRAVLEEDRRPGGEGKGG